MTTSRLRWLGPPHLLLALLLGCAAWPALAQVPASPPPTKQAPPIRYVLLRGQVRSQHDSTTLPGVVLVFITHLTNNAPAAFNDTTLADGSYRVRLPAGRRYVVGFRWGGKLLDTQPFAFGNSTSSGTHTFYLRAGENVMRSGHRHLAYASHKALALPPLPLPLPPPSTRCALPHRFLAADSTFAQADDHLTAALGVGHYTSANLAYYAIPGGYALVTQLEQIKDDGSPQPEPARWSDATTSAGMWQSLRELFIATPGHFRILVFAVSDQEPTIVTSAPAMTQTRAEGLLGSGHLMLDPGLGQQPLPPGCRVMVLVYEYTKADTSVPPVFVETSAVPADAQLAHSHIKVLH